MIFINNVNNLIIKNRPNIVVYGPSLHTLLDRLVLLNKTRHPSVGSREHRLCCTIISHDPAQDNSPHPRLTRIGYPNLFIYEFLLFIISTTEIITFYIRSVRRGVTTPCSARNMPQDKTTEFSVFPRSMKSGKDILEFWMTKIHLDYISLNQPVFSNVQDCKRDRKSL